MIDWEKVVSVPYAERKKVLLSLIRGQLESEANTIANLANIAALLYHGMEDVSWVGFYLKEGEDLVLGPFQGLAACNRIRPPAGVCGTAFSERRKVVVPNVEAFPGHIACDARTRSEIVYPICLKDGTMGVLDIDSIALNRFTEEEQRFLDAVAQLLND